MDQTIVRCINGIQWIFLVNNVTQIDRELRNFVDPPVGVTASKLVTGDRQLSYGDPLENYDKIAEVWTALTGHPIDRRLAMHMMIALKMCRDLNVPNKDNEVDICGYAHLLQFDREDQEDFEDD